MPKPKGSKKTGGRQKGTPNKVTTDIIETLNSIGYNPALRQAEIAKHAWEKFQEKLEAAENAETPDEKRKASWGMATLLSVAQTANAELMKFVYPTRKAISGDMDVKHSFTEWIKDQVENEDDDE